MALGVASQSADIRTSQINITRDYPVMLLRHSMESRTARGGEQWTLNQQNQMSTSEEGGLEEPVPTAAPPDDDPKGKDEDQCSQTIGAKKDGGFTLGGDPDSEVDLEQGEGTELKKKPSSIIPRRKRRGLFASVVIGIPEIDDPVQYSNKIKGFIVFIIAVAAIAAPMGFVPNPSRKHLETRSAIYLPALPHVIAGLHTNANLVNLTVALYMWALGLFPLWWSAASERVGRRTVYVVSFALWILFNALCATSHNIVELIIMRVLAAGAGASVQAVGAGTLADIYIPQQRGRAMGFFYIGPLMGPLVVRDLFAYLLSTGSNYRRSIE